MTKLTFTDGESFDTDGELRIERRKDGYYVVGGGILCPADSREEAERMLATYSSFRRPKPTEEER